MANEKELKILERYKEFFSDLTAFKIMDRVLIFLDEEASVKDAKKIMKSKKIGGIPIVDGNHQLINIITTEDIIHFLERNEIEKNIKDIEKKQIMYLKKNDSFEKVVEYFAEYGYGRFPVVDEDGKLLGMITNNNLLFSVISKLSTLYLHDERRREILDSPLSILLENKINEKEPEFNYHINNSDVNNAGEGSALLKKFLKDKNIDKKLIRKISISTYEAEVNVVIHGGGIGKIITKFGEDSIVVFIEDEGPGIENINQVMVPGFSTAPEYIRSLGFGAGMGLPNIKRFADKLIITSEKSKGVKLEMVFWLKEDKE